MTRSDLIAALASRFPNLMAKDAEISVKEILDAISNTLVKGDRVEIRGFGSFGLNYRPARTGRNPKSGEKVSFAIAPVSQSCGLLFQRKYPLQHMRDEDERQERTGRSQL